MGSNVLPGVTGHAPRPGARRCPYDAARRRDRLICLLLLLSPAGLTGQTLDGRLLDLESGAPIDLGVLVLLTADGDTVAMTASDPAGRFTLTASGPGAYMLLASAWGYTPKEDGAYELGPGEPMEIEFGLAPRAFELEGILVTTERPPPDHPLIRNGFVERYQLGLGHFISPRDLERTVFPDTEALFHYVPGVRIVSTTLSARGGEALGIEIERLVMRGPFGGWCTPTVFMDGQRVPYRPQDGMTLSELVPLPWIQAVEIYRNVAAVPPGFGPTGECGVLVFWTGR